MRLTARHPPAKARVALRWSRQWRPQTGPVGERVFSRRPPRSKTVPSHPARWPRTSPISWRSRCRGGSQGPRLVHHRWRDADRPLYASGLAITNRRAKFDLGEEFRESPRAQLPRRPEGPCPCARGANFVRQCTARAANRGCGTGSTHPRRILARRWSHWPRTCRPSVPTECGVVSSRGSNRSCQPGDAERQRAASHVVKPPHSRSSNPWATHRRSILKTLASTRPQRPRSRAENRAEIA